MKPHRRIRSIFLVLLFCMQPIVAVAASGSADPAFRFYSVIDGLTQSEVYDIEQDKAGYLWFTTARGLNRYDGIDFKQYTIADGLPTNSLTALEINADNSVWIGDVKGGITILRGGRIAHVIDPVGDDSTPILDIEFIGDRVFAIAEAVGIVEIRNAELESASVSVVPDSKGAIGLTLRDNIIWVYADSGLYRLDRGASTTLQLVDETIRLAHGDNIGTLWVVDNNNRVGVWKEDGFDLRASIELDKKIRDLSVDKDGTVWATAASTLFKIDGEKQPVQSPVGRFNGIDGVSSLFVDRENSLWLSSDSGLVRFLGDRFRHYRLQTSTDTETVWGISQDRHRRMWFGTQSRLLLLNTDENLRTVGAESGVPDGVVRDVAADGKGNLWFGVGERGLFRLDVDILQSQHISGTEGAEILDIEIASDGAIWVTTMESGIFRYDTTQRQLTRFDVPRQTSVYTIDIWPDGSIWYGADEVGLVHLVLHGDEGHTNVIFGADSGLHNLLFDHIRLTAPDEAWVATEEGGLYRFSGGEFKNYGDSTPLADQTVYIVEPLDNGSIVVGGEQGLYQFVPGRTGITHYNQLVGFVGLETNVHATFTDADGYLWIGTINGATRMDVNKPMPTVPEPSPTIVSAETVLDRMPVENMQELAPDQLGVHTEYAAISLLNPKGIEYSYKLEGIDGDWTQATTNRSVSYPRIPPGSYEFKVRARYPGGEWSQSAASRRFNVLPHFWEELWFVALTILIFLLGLRAFTLYRTRKMQWLNDTLRAQVEDRTQSIERAKQSLEDSNKRLSKEIEERRKSDEARAEVETRFRRAFENAPIGMGLLDANGSLFDANPALRNMLWSESQPLTDVSFIDTIDEVDRERFVVDYRKLTRSESDSLDEKLSCRNAAGEELHTVANLSAIRAENGAFLYSVLQIQDITESQKLTLQLEYQASYDELTGLLNRRAFETELERAWARGGGDHSSYLMFMDLDQFKVVNDTSGHVAGDQLLRAVSEILHDCVRANDVVARLGGDEFGIILWECPTKVAERIAESIRSAIEVLRFHWDDETYRIGVSIGGIPIDPEIGDVNELQQLADAACYAAKEAGRNRVHMVSGDKDSARVHRGQVRWVQRLREAMENNRFAIYGQVIKPLKADIIEAERLEILLRLRDPETRKLIPPSAFLPAAERYGLSFELDKWVVRSLLDTLFIHQEFQAEPRSYWINLSGVSIGDPRFADFLTDAIQRSPLPPGTINFEITETAVIRSLTDASKLMSALREMGCQFALDDFGSGLSSFGYLKKLPVDFLKIDGMFIRDLIRDKTDRIFVKSIIDISHTLNIKTIAEFVENDELLEIVTGLGADYAQGFAMGRPFVLAPCFPDAVPADSDSDIRTIKAG